jgi:hypothetical protein
MIEGYSPVVQALLGTLFTWGVTAAGSALVFFATAEVCMTLVLLCLGSHVLAATAQTA